MPDTITLLGSLARLDMQAVVGQPVWVKVHHAPHGKLLGGTEPPGTVLGEPGYAPTGYGSARPLVTDEQGLFGGVLPWEDGGIYRVDVPGDVTRYLMMGTGAGEHPAGSTVNVRMLPGPDGVVTPPLVALDALVGEAVEDYLTAHPPTGGGGVTDHGALTGLDQDDHPHYLTNARGDARYVLPGALAKADVGLSNVDNTSDAAKPISTATATAITALAPKVNPALTATTPAPVLTTVTTPALSGWALTGSAVYSAGSITVGPASGSLSTDIPVTNDTVYQIDLTTSASTGGDVTVSLGAASATYPAAGITSVTIAATETGTRTLTIGGTTWSATITGVTVGELTRQSPAATIGAAEVRAWGTNTGLGSGVHRSLTSGVNNTGIGMYAQYGLTTGRYNTGIGYGAQYSLTTGRYNTGIGMYAQYGLTTGLYNTGIGFNAQYGLTTGLYNTGIGYGAQRAITTGANNTGIGMNAQYSLTAGGSNVAIGYGAQYTPAGNGTNATTTGARQVSIGVETGQSVSTQLNDITTLGHRSRAGADFGTAVGSGAHAAHLRSVALGSTTTTTADDQVMVGARDVEITSATRGVILQSPNGTRYRVTVTDAGALTVSAV